MREREREEQTKEGRCGRASSPTSSWVVTSRPHTSGGRVTTALGTDYRFGQHDDGSVTRPDRGPTQSLPFQSTTNPSTTTKTTTTTTTTHIRPWLTDKSCGDGTYLSRGSTVWHCSVHAHGDHASLPIPAKTAPGAPCRLPPVHLAEHPLTRCPGSSSPRRFVRPMTWNTTDPLSYGRGIHIDG